MGSIREVLGQVANLMEQTEAEHAGGDPITKPCPSIATDDSVFRFHGMTRVLKAT